MGRTIDAAAQAVGGRKPGLSARQKALRDTAIVARAAQGWKQKRIAEAFGVSERTVRDVLTGYRSAPSGMDQLPMQLVEDLMRDYRAMMGDFEHMAVEYAESHPAISLAAKRHAQAARVDLVSLQRMLGLLPTNLGLFRAEADLRRLGEMVLDRLAEFEQGRVSAGDVARLVREEVMEQALRDLPASRR